MSSFWGNFVFQHKYHTDSHSHYSSVSPLWNWFMFSFFESLGAQHLSDDKEQIVEIQGRFGNHPTEHFYILMVLQMML